MPENLKNCKKMVRCKLMLDKDSALGNVSEGIERVVEELRKKK